jgi:hypothetical protein
VARKYSRDNRGRFASSGTGATARGGRLKTASGGKRATQTMSAKGAGGAGVIKGRPARTVAGESVMRKLPKASPAATPKPTAPKRTQAGRTAGTVAKPRGLKPGAVTNSIMNKDRATIKAASTGIDRAQRRIRQLGSAQREIDRKRANPIGGKAFRGQATKRLNKQQRKLDKSMGKVVSAVELNYKPKRAKAEARLAQMSRATRATSGLRVPRQRTVYQRNVFGGSQATYG